MTTPNKPTKNETPSSKQAILKEEAYGVVKGCSMAPASFNWLTLHPIAHRGLHKHPHCPENSLAAFRAASNAGYPAELDVRLLTDGHIAVFHDATLERMTGTRGPLATLTAADLRDLRLGGTSEPLPLLTDVLAEVAGRVPLLIELKSEADMLVGPLEDAVRDLLRQYTGTVALQSFRVETVAYLRDGAEESTPVGQLATSDLWAGDQGIGEGTRLPDFLAYHLSAPPTRLTEQFRGQGIPLLVWTVRTPAEIERARTVADNFIFDDVRPALAG